MVYLTSDLQIRWKFTGFGYGKCVLGCIESIGWLVSNLYLNQHDNTFIHPLKILEIFIYNSFKKKLCPKVTTGQTRVWGPESEDQSWLGGRSRRSHQYGTKNLRILFKLIQYLISFCKRTKNWNIILKTIQCVSVPSFL